MNYEKIYNDIISKARSEDRKKIKGGVYYEAHHIIPKCLGGEGKTTQHNHPNIILLTAKEHYIAHRLLCEIYPNNNGLHYAMRMMINGCSFSKKRYIPSGRIYGRLKEYINKIPPSEESRKKMSAYQKNRPVTSEEIRKTQSIAAKNRPLRGPMSDDQKKKISAANKGRIMPPKPKETRQKMSLANKGRISWNKGAYLSKETRQKMSDSHAGQIPWNKDIPVADEIKKKISAGNKGKIRTEEARKKMSTSAKNRPPLTDESRQKMSDSQKGRTFSEETRLKMSEARKYYLSKIKGPLGT